MKYIVMLLALGLFGSMAMAEAITKACVEIPVKVEVAKWVYVKAQGESIYIDVEAGQKKGCGSASVKIGHNTPAVVTAKLTGLNIPNAVVDFDINGCGKTLWLGGAGEECAEINLCVDSVGIDTPANMYKGCIKVCVTADDDC